MDPVARLKPLLLFFPFNYLSHYLRCLELASLLRSYFDVEFAGSGVYDDFIAQAGFRTFPCKAIDAQDTLRHLQVFDFSWINQETLEPVFDDQYRILVERKPLAVFGDSSLTLKMAAEKAEVTYISLMNGYMSKYYAAARPLSRTHPAYRIANSLPQVLVRLATQNGESFMFKRVHRPFEKIRQKNELSAVYSYLDELEGDINLICDLPELFPQKRLPADYYMIPPLCFGAAAAVGRLSFRCDSQRKRILVSLGSTGDWSKLAFLNDPVFSKYDIVTTADEQHILNAPHITSLGFVNLRECLPSTDLVICHGGNGTIYQSLLHGVPLLCKTNHFEQEWNAEALERSGTGMSIDGLEGVAAHLEVIDQWIHKKGKGSCKLFQQKLQESSLRLKVCIPEIRTAILQAGSRSSLPKISKSA